MPTSPVGDTDFTARVIQASRPVLVEFWKQGCGPCMAMQPAVARLAGERTDIDVVTYEVVLGSPLHRRWKRFGIMATPTFVLFRDGEEVWRTAGVRSYAQLATEIAEALAGPAQRGVA